MHNINFDIPYWWLLFLLIPAIALTLIPYFRLSKKYRKTRNRITSMVLHVIIMVLAISVLSGMIIKYDLANDENEIILLVDVSDTTEHGQYMQDDRVKSAEKRDEFIQTVINSGRYDNYRIGIVTFGYNQIYAVPLTLNVDTIYDKYLDAELPDTSATNVEDAILFAKDLFKYPKTAKIVLVTDGKETDGDMFSAVRAVEAQKIMFDVAYIDSSYSGDDVQIFGVELPEYHVSVGQQCTIKVLLQSKSNTQVTIRLYDNDYNDAVNGVVTQEVIAGATTITFNHIFQQQGFHELRFTVENNGGSDAVSENNQYMTYMLLSEFDKILIIEKGDESARLQGLLTADSVYNVDIVNIRYDSEIPATVDELRNYDQIILNNIANGDLIRTDAYPYEKLTNDNEYLPKDFDKMLYSYVHDYGGGILTTGGFDDDGIDANAYNRADMVNTTYQSMLPVQAIDYTPPLGVVVIIDRSGSMSATYDDVSYLDWAKSGASACLQAMSERDYFGLMTLESNYDMILPMTSRTQEAKILEAISSIDGVAGGTVFASAIERAGQALRALEAVERRHIIIISDGMPGDGPEDYEGFVQDYYEKSGITTSFVGINMDADAGYDINTPLENLDLSTGLSYYKKMLRIAIIGHGRIYPVKKVDRLPELMREELKVPDLKQVNQEEFYPTAANVMSPLFNGVERITETGPDMNKLTVSLGGFFGVKVRSDADLILKGEFNVPLYAQWKFGKGMVGSFMCDLNGTWSADFMADPNGVQFIKNVIGNLMPTESIRSSEITVVLKEHNYLNQMSVYTTIESGQRIEGRVINLSADEEQSISLNSITQLENYIDAAFYVTLALNASNNFSRCNLVIKQAGIYKIELVKYSADNQIVATYETYKSFSYSKEYNTFVESTKDEILKSLDSLAKRAGGVVIDDLSDPIEVFEGLSPYSPEEFDPRTTFIIIVIILFLLDIAVRKFKFKWPHEIYQSYKSKKIQ